MISEIPLTQLSEHPLLARVGRAWEMADLYQSRSKRGGKDASEHAERAEALAAEFAALVESIDSVGVMEPIKVIASLDDPSRYLVIDGRHRLHGARQLSLMTIPAVIIDPSLAKEIITAAVAGKRQSKGSRALLAVKLNPEVLASAVGNPNGQSRINAGLLARQFGVGQRTIEQAIQLEALLAHAELTAPIREEAEAAIWSGSGLGGVIAGLKSRLATGGGEVTGKATAPSAGLKSWARVSRVFNQLDDTLKKWGDLDEAQQETAADRLRDIIQSVPGELRKKILSEAETQNSEQEQA